MKLTEKQIRRVIQEELANHLNEEDQWKQGLDGIDTTHVKQILNAMDRAVALGIAFDKIAAAIAGHIEQRGYR